MPVFQAGGPGIPGKQAKMRRNVNPVDQFGRKWLTAYEVANGESTGGWMITWGALGDPLRTPGKYIDFTRDESGQTEPKSCRVDFDRWIADVEQDERNWYYQLNQNAMHHYKRGSLTPEDAAKLDQDQFLMDLTGPKPFPSSDVLRMAKAGNKRLLGLEPLTQKERALLRMPTLEDLQQPTFEEHAPAPTDPAAVPDTYPEFVSWVFKTKQVVDLKQAAQLWKEHRALLAEV